MRDRRVAPINNQKQISGLHISEGDEVSFRTKSHQSNKGREKSFSQPGEMIHIPSLEKNHLDDSALFVNRGSVTFLKTH